MVRFLTGFVLGIGVLPSIAASDIAELPVSADYCAIYHALTGEAAAICDQPVFDAPTRSIPDDTGVIPPPDVPAPGRGYFIRFAFNSEVLSQEYQAHLDRLKTVLDEKELAEICLKLVGHTDTVGSQTYNQSLSERRATSVKSYLVASLGLSDHRIITEGMGEVAPLADMPGDDARNRRVEVLAKTSANDCSA